MGNHDPCHLGLGTNTQSLCIEGLSMEDQEQSDRPAPGLAFLDNVVSHFPTAIRENMWAGGYID